MFYRKYSRYGPNARTENLIGIFKVKKENFVRVLQSEIPKNDSTLFVTIARDRHLSSIRTTRKSRDKDDFGKSSAIGTYATRRNADDIAPSVISNSGTSGNGPGGSYIGLSGDLDAKPPPATA